MPTVYRHNRRTPVFAAENYLHKEIDRSSPRCNTDIDVITGLEDQKLETPFSEVIASRRKPHSKAICSIKIMWYYESELTNEVH